MPYFDRFDICDAYSVYHTLYSDGGYATGRRERLRGATRSDIQVRLSRMGYVPGSAVRSLGIAGLLPNAYAIFDALRIRRAKDMGERICEGCGDQRKPEHIVWRGLCRACAVRDAQAAVAS